MANEIIQVPRAGLAVPASRVDFYEWRAQVRHLYKIELGNDESELFRLIDRTTMLIQHYLYRIGSTEPSLLDQQEYNLSDQRAPFMQSELYASLSRRTADRISTILQKVVKARQRKTAADAEIERLRLVISVQEAQMQLGDLQLESARRQRQLQHRMAQLDEFAEAKSADLTDMISIREMQATEWWTDDVDQFYEAMMAESYEQARPRRQSEPPNNRAVASGPVAVENNAAG